MCSNPTQLDPVVTRSHMYPTPYHTYIINPNRLDSLIFEFVPIRPVSKINTFQPELINRTQNRSIYPNWYKSPTRPPLPSFNLYGVLPFTSVSSLTSSHQSTSPLSNSHVFNYFPYVLQLFSYKSKETSCIYFSEIKFFFSDIFQFNCFGRKLRTSNFNSPYPKSSGKQLEVISARSHINLSVHRFEL